jgi:predicted DNA binding CopG/RHH family protein
MTDQIIRITVRLREDVYIKTKLLATARGVTITDILNEALEKYVQEHEKEIKRMISDMLTDRRET